MNVVWPVTVVIHKAINRAAGELGYGWFRDDVVCADHAAVNVLLTDELLRKHSKFGGAWDGDGKAVDFELEFTAIRPAEPEKVAGPPANTEEPVAVASAA